MSIAVLIMAGGSGERFWPLSTKEKPKQLLKLIDSERSLIRMTVDRVLPLTDISRVFIATNSIQAPAVKEELPDLPEGNIIIEPAFKDTAAAIGFGTTVIESIYPNSTIVVLASDHLIKNEDNFIKRVKTAVETAENQNAIVTLGIKPTYPETGYGYLETNECYVGEPAKVVRFCEKPALDIAKEYVSGGRHLWNSGMFIFKSSVIIDAFKKYLPGHFKILESIAKLGKEMRNPDNSELKNLFAGFEKISVDFGIMEKYDNTMVIPVDFGWNDIGSYPALADVFPKNDKGSVIRNANVNEVSSSGNIVIGSGTRKISLLGVTDFVVVDTNDNLLICSKLEAQNIKKLI